MFKIEPLKQETDMSPRVQHVVSSRDLTLTITITFSNRETRIIDVKPDLNTGMFRELRDLRMSNLVRSFLANICPDALYKESTPV